MKRSCKGAIVANPEIDRNPVMARIDYAFTLRNLFYEFHQQRRTKRLDKLNKQMASIAAKGVALEKSRQASLEAQWLINYTDDWKRADETLDRFEASLHEGSQPPLQQPDGSWAQSCTEPYRKLEPTVDALQRDLTGLKLKPLTFMQDLQDPAYVETWLDSVRCSGIHETGRNNRDEFGSLISSLTQLFFKSKLKKVFERHPELAFKVSDNSFKHLRDYLWRIQSDETGYWGPTYDFDGEVIEVQDLSYTFHIVKYYNDNGNRQDLRKTDKIIPTTRIIEDFSYPNGLKQQSLSPLGQPTLADHNNYDLVTMFQQLWTAMSEPTKDDARREIKKLIDWCLTKSLQNNQEFAPSKNMSPQNSYYYGVVFLQVVGFWLSTPFWTTSPIPVPDGTLQPKDLAGKLLKRFNQKYNDGGTDAQKVVELLEQASGTRPPAS
jgi:hypothetical protein